MSAPDGSMEVAGFVRGLAVLHHIALDLTDLCNTRPIQVLVNAVVAFNVRRSTRPYLSRVVAVSMA